MRILLGVVGAIVVALSPAGADRIRPLGHVNPGAEFPGRAPSPGFRIFDATDPRHPAEIGSWIAPESLKAGRQAVFVHSVRVNPTATRAYLSYWDLGTVILDISRLARPRMLGR